MIFLKKYFGPSTLVTAAFIGPGTLTVCTLSGASHGYSLLWVLLFATLATITLQEMAARLGLITKHGLAEAIRSEIVQPISKWLSITLVFIAIVIGNAAYEAGNISGAALGLSGVFGPSLLWPVSIGIGAFIILFMGRFQLIERILIILVILMSLVFLITASIIKPQLSDVFRGFIPNVDDANFLAIAALIGTTIVPYNLFLHASTVNKKWKKEDQLKDLKSESAIAIALGGVISMAIVITSATTISGTRIEGISEMATQLEPLLGSWSRYFLALGLFSAGISSAITAPLAAAYTAKGIFGWKKENGWKFRSIWILVLVSGIFFSTTAYRPVVVIQLAQIANGILLPIVVFFLLYTVNKRSLLGQYANRPWQNLVGVVVILISLMISLRSLNSVFNFL
ncbi:MAG: Nramp family divalent metal transporter [Bacteroidota bacterium]